MTMKVVSPAITSVPTVVPASRSLKNASSMVSSLPRSGRLGLGRLVVGDGGGARLPPPAPPVDVLAPPGGGYVGPEPGLDVPPGPPGELLAGLVRDHPAGRADRPEERHGQRPGPDPGPADRLAPAGGGGGA